MAILVQCPECRYRNSESRPICKKCDLDLVKTKGKVYWIEFYTKEGKRKRKRVGKWKKLAVEALAKKKVEVAENKFLDKAQQPVKMKFKDFACEYEKWVKTNNKSPDRKTRMLRGLIPDFGEKYLNEIDTWLIEKYRHKRKDTNQKAKGAAVKPSTLNREMALLKHMFSKAMEWGLVLENPARPIKMLKENNKRVRFLSLEEMDRLLSVCAGYLMDIVQVALNTGMRKGEILSLRWRDIDFNFGMIHVADSKNSESREIPINDVLLETLTALKGGAAHDQFVFLNPKTGKPYDDVKKSYRAALEEAGIRDFTFHDLRHTFASHLVMDGCDLMTLKELLGHKDISMTMRYAHLSPDHKRLAVQKMAAILTGKREPASGFVGIDGHLYGHQTQERTQAG